MDINVLLLESHFWYQFQAVVTVFSVNGTDMRKLQRRFWGKKPKEFCYVHDKQPVCFLYQITLFASLQKTITKSKYNINYMYAIVILFLCGPTYDNKTLILLLVTLYQ